MLPGIAAIFKFEHVHDRTGESIEGRAAEPKPSGVVSIFSDDLKRTSLSRWHVDNFMTATNRNIL